MDHRRWTLQWLSACLTRSLAAELDEYGITCNADLRSKLDSATIKTPL
jgi:hypothetical protein